MAYLARGGVKNGCINTSNPRTRGAGDLDAGKHGWYGSFASDVKSENMLTTHKAYHYNRDAVVKVWILAHMTFGHGRIWLRCYDKAVGQNPIDDLYYANTKLGNGTVFYENRRNAVYFPDANNGWASALHCSSASPTTGQIAYLERTDFR